jgi:hypothetical protein
MMVLIFVVVLRVLPRPIRNEVEIEGRGQAVSLKTLKFDSAKE